MATHNSNLQRWMTGLALAAVLLLIIVMGSPVVLTAIVALVIVIGLWEYNGIVFGPGHRAEKTESLLFAFLIPWAVLAGDARWIAAILTFAMLIVFMVFLWQVRKSFPDPSSVMKVMFGLLYIPLLTSHFVLLRKLEGGIYWVLLVLVIGIIGDTVALYVGKSLGKRKLLEAVSPGKTVEGTLGLIAGSTLAACVFGYFWLPGVHWIHFPVLGFVGGIIGQLGDLCESAIKRSHGKKDASDLLPGHGGLMDRMDSLIFLAPFVYYYRIFVMG
ncbi:MAG: phosphatidate cytidylyltransferase [Smithellaceae bacterium]|jgi:phosphatidate cytidylyltransferase|nr:phosphatidate cytidylyltransferase [Smithellaceae bacterium]MDD3258654.1 phosphatidate cytidylyltransferase [Smithellaceae bacterium]MDD3848871.1 phosphatidate cytidylyltransferase [Smithellaceae bacterium]HOG11990.1 phosphatidate cytidylyltransferase [Smithellaceae bacterium]HOQ71193.1 phosphatidate cytidylyltransferase [Smithellaceae bacterium]